MGCVQPNNNKNAVPKGTCQSFDSRQNCYIEDSIQKKKSSSTRQNISTFNTLPPSISIQLPQRTIKIDKKLSLAPTQSSKQIHPDKNSGKNKSKASNKTPSNQDSSNPQKNCQITQKTQEIDSRKQQVLNQQKIDNGSILKKKSNFIRNKRTKSAPKKQIIENQNSKGQEKTKKRVTIKIEDNNRGSFSSSLLFSDTEPSTSKKVPHIRQPRGKSCNLFKTFENDFIEDEDDEYFFKKNFRSPTGIQDKKSRK